MLPGYSLPEISRLTAAADQIAENMAVLSERFEAAFTEETAENMRLALENIQQVSTQVTRMFGAQETTLADLSASLQATTETLGQAAEAVRRASGHIEAAISRRRVEGDRGQRGARDGAARLVRHGAAARRPGSLRDRCLRGRTARSAR